MPDISPLKNHGFQAWPGHQICAEAAKGNTDSQLPRKSPKKWVKVGSDIIYITHDIQPVNSKCNVIYNIYIYTIVTTQSQYQWKTLRLGYKYTYVHYIRVWRESRGFNPRSVLSKSCMAELRRMAWGTDARPMQPGWMVRYAWTKDQAHEMLNVKKDHRTLEVFFTWNPTLNSSNLVFFFVR